MVMYHYSSINSLKNRIPKVPKLPFWDTRAALLSWLKYSVIRKDGLNFVSLYFRIRTSDKYDVNYI